VLEILGEAPFLTIILESGTRVAHFLLFVKIVGQLSSLKARSIMSQVFVVLDSKLLEPHHQL